MSTFADESSTCSHVEKELLRRAFYFTQSIHALRESSHKLYFIIKHGTCAPFELQRIFFWCARYGYLTLAQILLSRVNLHARQEMALRVAAEHGHLQVVQFLVDNGANIHKWSNFALQIACFKGHLGTAQFLVEKGAKIHANNELALEWAAENGQLQVVRFLVEKGANIHSRGELVLKRAREGNHHAVVQFLVERGHTGGGQERSLFS